MSTDILIRATEKYEIYDWYYCVLLVFEIIEGKPHAISEIFLGILVQCHILLSANEKRFNHLFRSRIINAKDTSPWEYGVLASPCSRTKKFSTSCFKESNCDVLRWTVKYWSTGFVWESVFICAEVMNSESQYWLFLCMSTFCITISLAAIRRPVGIFNNRSFFFSCLIPLSIHLSKILKNAKKLCLHPCVLIFSVLETCQALINRNHFKRTYLITGGDDNW